MRGACAHLREKVDRFRDEIKTTEGSRVDEDETAVEPQLTASRFAIG
jgi:hypothetical protein